MNASLVANELIDAMLKRKEKKGVVQTSYRKGLGSNQLELNLKGAYKNGVSS